MSITSLTEIAKQADSEPPAVEAAEQLGELSANCVKKRSALVELAVSSNHEKAAIAAVEELPTIDGCTVEDAIKEVAQKSDHEKAATRATELIAN